MSVPSARLSQRAAARLAWVLCGLSIAGAAAFVVFELLRGQVPPANEAEAWSNAQEALGAVVFSTVGAVIASRRKDNTLAWLFLAIGLSFGLSAVADVFTDTFAFRSSLWQWGNWINTWAWVPGWFFMLTFVLLLFPNGHLPSPRWAWVSWLAGIGIAVIFIGGVFNPSAGGTAGYESPLPTLPLALTENAALPLGTLLCGIAAIGSIVALILRYRRSSGDEREQIKWFVYAGVATIALTPARTVWAPEHPVTLILGLASIPILPVGVGVAVMKYRLYEIDVVINRTVVYAALAAFITAVYVAIVVGLGAVVGAGASKPNLGLSILATAVVAVAFQPVKARIEKLANRLVYGQRATPYEVLSEFSSRMAGTFASEDLVPRMARILAEGTGARSAVVWLRVGDRLKPEAAWPMDDLPGSARPMSSEGLPPIDATLALPVEHRGELLGALSLSKQAGDRLTPAEEHLAGDLASGAGLVLRNVRLTEELMERLEELHASRQRLVAAQDSERRRLERNIHDGAQQQLVALAVKLRLARQLTAKDPQKASAMLEQVEREIADALEDLRDLARGIYPPLLADQGLAAALAAQARRAPLPVAIEADALGRFPEDIEAAVYFCVLEALQNVAKYAGASRAIVRLADADGDLAFEIEDDGAGFDPGQTFYGTGLQGMADRLAALGGRLEVSSEPGSGTTIRGSIPSHVSPRVELTGATT